MTLCVRLTFPQRRQPKAVREFVLADRFAFTRRDELGDARSSLVHQLLGRDGEVLIILHVMVPTSAFKRPRES